MFNSKSGISILSIATFLFNLLLLKILWVPDYFLHLIELSVFLIALNLFVQISSVSKFIEHLPVIHKIFLSFLIFICATGQTLGKSEITFPFPSWDMYQKTVEISGAKYYRYIAVTDEGKEVHLNSTNVYPSLSKMRHDVIRERTIDAYLNTTPAIPQDQPDDSKFAETKHSGLKGKLGSALRNFFETKREVSKEFQEEQLKRSAWTIALAHQKRYKKLHIKSLKIIHGYLAKTEGRGYEEHQREILNFVFERN